jgi:hypothetical protein
MALSDPISMRWKSRSSFTNGLLDTSTEAEPLKAPSSSMPLRLLKQMGKGLFGKDGLSWQWKFCVGVRRAKLSSTPPRLHAGDRYRRDRQGGQSAAKAQRAKVKLAQLRVSMSSAGTAGDTGMITSIVQRGFAHPVPCS